ncbi:hypothetical protein BD779DRAFT_1681421 [Infundibulicybe gibba]|nr:hypothetical protein BD779DRAFT_1681418 [Infundibulicybe gibba]KAF8870102.1 hypothetical protein BD779DRAFT_1681421 [Infundibulicybe gibba]
MLVSPSPATYPARSSAPNLPATSHVTITLSAATPSPADISPPTACLNTQHDTPSVILVRSGRVPTLFYIAPAPFKLANPLCPQRSTWLARGSTRTQSWRLFSSLSITFFALVAIIRPCPPTVRAKETLFALSAVVPRAPRESRHWFSPAPFQLINRALQHPSAHPTTPRRHHWLPLPITTAAPP